MFKAGVLRIPLRSPLYFHADRPVRRLCLDGVLAGMIYARTGDGPGAVASLAELLAHWAVAGERIPQASQVIFQDRKVNGETRQTIFRSPLRYLDEPDLRDAIVGFKSTNSPDTIIRPYKGGMMNSYIAVDTDVVFFLFKGDLDRVAEIVDRAGRIGALRAKGGGEIDRNGLAVDPVPTTDRMFGVICNHTLMRPVPARLESELRDRGAIDYRKGVVEAWRAPYHISENKEPCLVPTQPGAAMMLSLMEMRALCVASNR